MENNSFSRLGVKLWIKIPRYITDLPKNIVKRVLRKLLFDILQKEDDYNQIPMIIKDTLAKGFNVSFCFSVLSFKSLNALYVSKRCVN